MKFQIKKLSIKHKRKNKISNKTDGKKSCKKKH